MAPSKQTASSSNEVVGIKSDVYERHWELTWMTKDDVETFESRISDKTLFQNIAILFLGASVPLGIEKGIDYFGSGSATDLATLIVCVGGAAIGAIFQFLALSRRNKIDTFKRTLFQNDRLMSRQFTMIDPSGSTSTYAAKG